MAQETVFQRIADTFRRPLVSPLLIVAMVAVHAGVAVWRSRRGVVGLWGAWVGVRGPRVLERFGGMKASAVDGGELWRLVSAVFLHVNLLHLGLNAIGLFLVGRLVEACYGRTRMAAIFLAAGVGGAACSWLIARTTLSVGASGGIYGLLGAALVFVLRHKAELPDDVAAHLRRQLLWSVGLNLPLGLFLPQIDQTAHVGGLIVGAIGGALAGNPVSLHPADRADRRVSAALWIGMGLAILAGVHGVWSHWKP